MALKPKTAAANITGAFDAGLVEAPDLNDEFEAVSSNHLPAYTLSLKDLASLSPGEDIDNGKARETSWQCLAVSKSQSNGKALIGEVTPINKAPRPKGHVFDGPVRMTSLSFGGIIDTSFKKAQDLKQREAEIAKEYNITGDYEPRMLRIPGLLVTVVWLRSEQQDGKHWIVPLHTTKTSGLPNEIYSMKEFLEVVQPMAKKRLTRPVLE